MTFNDILRLLQEHGIVGLFMSGFLFLIYYIIRAPWFGQLISKITDTLVIFFMKRKVKEVPQNDISESDILNHDIFNFIDFWCYSKVPTFQFSTEYRTIIFRKYLTIFLKTYKRGLYEFINKRDFHKMDQSQLWKSLLELINKIVWEYERDCEESGIPKIIVMKMKSKNNDIITLTIDLIESISNSQFYESDKNLLKMYSILNILLSILENTITNSQGVCNSINGQLKGLSIIEGGRTYIEP
jgi:hypothetical protein